MTEQEKQLIAQLRSQNLGYRTIAKQIGLSTDAVKSYCKYHKLPKGNANLYRYCLFCSAPLEQIAGQKPKKFCSDACRFAWWSSHRDLALRKEKNLKKCEYCGKNYYSEKRESRFCSCKCFAEYRKNGGENIAAKEDDAGCEADSQADISLETESPPVRIESEETSERAQFPPLPSHPSCDACPWFHFGKRFIEANRVLVEEISADCGKLTNSKE